MPDDTKTAVAEQEEQNASDFDAGFGDEAAVKEGAKAADEAGKAVPVDEGGSAAKPAKVEKDEPKAAAQAKEEGDKKAAEDKGEGTAAERLEARATAAAGETGKQDEQAPAKVEKQAPAAKVEKAAERKEVVSDEDALTDADLEAVKIKVGDGEQTLKEFGEGFPEVLAAADAIAKLRMQKAGFVTRDEVAGLQVQMANANFWSSVVTGAHDDQGKFVEGHPDARKIVATAEFGKWLGEQSKVVQALASSLDPMDGIAVVAAYKEHAGKAAREKKDGAARERTDKRVALHSDTARPARSTGDEGGKAKEGADDFDAGFNAPG